jgi:hypothetical protein
MARILVGEREIGVAEDLEEVMSRVVNARDGIRRGSGLVAPPGWLALTTSDTDEEIVLQAARIGYILAD